MSARHPAVTRMPTGPAYDVVALGPDTWEAFAELVERNNGVYGGCWCIGYHLTEKLRGADYRAMKEGLVRAGEAHAALVLDADGLAQGWAQFGSPDELPGIKHGRAYRNDPPAQPDWRITCIFVDSRHRRQGVARAALEGALALIATAGGGRVEAISEVTDGRVAQGRFLFSATVELFEELGFERVRQVGKHAWIVGGAVRSARLDGSPARSLRAPGGASRAPAAGRSDRVSAP